MPVVGWAGGMGIHRYLADVDHWIAFGLLGFVGGKMLLGALRGRERRTTPRRGGSSWCCLSPRASMRLLWVYRWPW
jgi:putative Mn2+ efflux pump MntP